MASYAVAAKPGEPVTDLGDSLDVLRAAFPPGLLRFELIDQACPGAADLLRTAGLAVTATVPVMALDAADLPPRACPPGLTIQHVRTTDSPSPG